MNKKIEPGHVLTAVTISITGVYSPLMIIILMTSEDNMKVRMKDNMGVPWENQQIRTLSP